MVLRLSVFRVCRGATFPSSSKTSVSRWNAVRLSILSMFTSASLLIWASSVFGVCVILQHMQYFVPGFIHFCPACSTLDALVNVQKEVQISQSVLEQSNLQPFVGPLVLLSFGGVVRVGFVLPNRRCILLFKGAAWQLRCQVDPSCLVRHWWWTFVYQLT